LSAPPRFTEGFPADPELDALVAAFSRGDFARVRRQAPPLIRAAASDEVREAARELLRRTEPDPLSFVFFALAAGLLAFLAVYWWRRAGP